MTDPIARRIVGDQVELILALAAHEQNEAVVRRLLAQMTDPNSLELLADLIEQLQLADSDA
jgi:hypothetical protein